jgi:hypothetical protein
MNFIKHQKDIKKLLTTQGGKQYAGCYIYSRDENDNTHKIGMSQAGLFNRIKGAGSCYPYKSEFWLKYVIISLDGHYVKGKKSNTIHIENALHNESKQMSTVKMQGDLPEQGQRPREYRLFTNNTRMYSLLKNTLNSHRDKWDYVVVFSKTGWDILANNRVVPKPIANVNKLKPKVSARKAAVIHSLQLNKTALTLPKGTQVGDKIAKSDNWDSFTVVEIISKKHIVAKFKGSAKLYDIHLQDGI